MRRRIVAALLIGGLCSTAVADDATQLPPLAVGTRVRVSAPGITTAPLAGTIRALDAKTVTLEVPGQAEPLAVPLDRIRTLEVSLGRRSRTSGALVGALLGAAVGALAGKAAHTNHGYNFESADEAAGALAGVLVGGTIGALIPPGDRWQAVAGSRYRVGFAPRLDRIRGITVAVAF